MSTKSSYDVRALNKSLAKLTADTNKVAEACVGKTVALQTESASFSFDETEAVPFMAAAGGAIVISVAGNDPIQLEHLVTSTAYAVADTLKTSFVNGMQEVIR